MAEREKEGSRGVDPVHKTKMIIIATGTAREHSSFRVVRPSSPFYLRRRRIIIFS